MTLATTALLLLAAITGVLGARARQPGRAGIAWAAATVALVGAAATTALAAATADGAQLAAVRVAAVLAAMAGGSIVVTTAFGLAGADTAPTGTSPSVEDEATPVTVSDAPSGTEPHDHLPPVEQSAEPLRGGLAIGILERAAITICVLATFSAGLAVIVAAKGLARYPELRNPGAAEQFIIGTFVSVLWAAACAAIAVAVGH